jgi:hypothetical protein
MAEREAAKRGCSDGRRRYCAPSLAKGPMLAVVTAADTVISGVAQ